MGRFSSNYYKDHEKSDRLKDNGNLNQHNNMQKKLISVWDDEWPCRLMLFEQNNVCVACGT